MTFPGTQKTPLDDLCFCFQVSLLDVYETDKMSLMKFDTLPGTDVLTYLSERSSYSESMVAEIAYQVLDGLAYIHWRGKVSNKGHPECARLFEF